jgi:hypothetical protein
VKGKRKSDTTVPDGVSKRGTLPRGLFLRKFGDLASLSWKEGIWIGT